MSLRSRAYGGQLSPAFAELGRLSRELRQSASSSALEPARWRPTQTWFLDHQKQARREQRSAPEAIPLPCRRGAPGAVVESPHCEGAAPTLPWSPRLDEF